MAARKTIEAWYNTYGGFWCASGGEYLAERYWPSFALFEQSLMLLHFVDSQGGEVGTFTGLTPEMRMFGGSTKVVETLSNAINVSGDWEDADVDAGRFSVRVNGATQELWAFVSAYDREECRMEFAGKINETLYCRYTAKVGVENTMDSTGFTPTPLPETGIFVGSVDLVVGNDSRFIPVVIGEDMYPMVTLIAPEGSTWNIAISNTLINTGTGFTVYLTTAVIEDGWKIKYVVIKK